jgi:hypothetical protein
MVDYLAALLYIVLTGLLLHNMLCSQGTPVFPDRPANEDDLPSQSSFRVFPCGLPSRSFTRHDIRK